MPITATLSLDATKWNEALKNATSNLKSFEVSTKNVGQQLQRAFSTFSGEKLIRDANLAAAAVTKLGGVTKLTATEQARLNATVTEAIAKYKALGQVAPAELSKINTELQALSKGQGLARAAESLQDFGHVATRAGTALTAGLTVPLVGLGVASAKAAIDFESAFAGVRKTVDATDEEFAAMEQAFRDLAKSIPISVNELAKLGEAAGALGIPKAEIVDFARVMALLGETTNVTADQAAESVAKIQNIFGAAGKETENFASTLVALGNAGASTESQILEMATRIAGAGNVIGLTQGEVLGFASALASVGLEAEAGGTAISRVMVDISAAVSQGGKDLDAFAKVAGASAQAFAARFKTDAAGAIQAFIEGLGRIKASGGDVIGTLNDMEITEVRLRDTLLRLSGAGDVLARSLDLQATAWEKNRALSDEAAERFKTTAAQLTLLWNRVKDVAITLGNALLPAIQAVTSGLGAALPVLDTVAKVFATLPTSVQLVGLGFAALAAAAGPALLIVGQMARALGDLIPLLVKYTGAANGAAIATKALGLALTAGLVAGVAAAVVALTKLQDATHDAWEEVKEGTPTWESFGETLKNAVARGLVGPLFSIGRLKTELEELNATIHALSGIPIRMPTLPKLPTPSVGAPLIAPGIPKDLAQIEAALTKTAGVATKTSAEAKKAAEEFAKAVQTLSDKLSGGEAIQGLQRLIAAFNGLPPSVRKSEAAQEAFLDEYLKLAPHLVRVPPALQKNVAAFNALALAAGKFSGEKVVKGLKSLEGIGEEIRDEFTTAFADVLEAEDKMIDGLAKQWETADIFGKIGERTDVERDFVNTAIDIHEELSLVMATENQKRLVALEQSKQRELAVLRAALGAQTEEYQKFAVIVEAKYKKLADDISVTFSEQLGRNLQDSLGGIANILADAIATGNWADVAADIGATIGGAIGGAIGAAVAGPVGAAVGEAFGKLLGPLLDKIIETRAEETQKRVATEFGVGISEGLAQAIEDASRDFGGNRQAAKLFNLDRIIEEGGGLSSANIDKMLANLRNVFVMIETGAFTTEQAMQVLDKNFADFAAFVTRDGALASEALLEIIELNERFGTSSKEVAEFVTAQLTGAIGGLTTFLENAEVTSQAAADGIAASVFGIFEELVKQGATPLEAIKQITPVLEQLDAQLKAAGLSGGGAFEQIRNLAGIASDAVKGPMVEAITGLGVALEGLHNSGVLNQEMFAGLATQVTDTYNKLIAQGTDGAQALQLVGPTLQTLWELQQDFGYAVDDATQKLIDQGVAAGQVGDQHRSVQEQMAIAMERTADALEALLTGLGIELPNATQTAADASGRMSDQMVEDLSIWGEAGIQSAEDIQAKIDALNAGDVSSRLVEDMQTFGTRGEEAVAGIQPEIDSLTFGPVTEEMIEDIKEWARAAGYSAEEIQEFLDRIDPKIPVEFDVPPFPKLPKPPTVKIPTRYERPDADSAAGFAMGGVVPGYAKGGVVYAQQGMWLPRGTDTVPAMLTPGEVVLPRDVVAALRSSAPGSVTVNLTITALDGADVERVVRSPGFRRALTATVRGNDGGVRTDLRADLGVR